LISLNGIVATQVARLYHSDVLLQHDDMREELKHSEDYCVKLLVLREVEQDVAGHTSPYVAQY
jgi:hypothetical protein